MKTQRRIIPCLLFTCTRSNKYGLTDAWLNAKEITVASSPTSSNRGENNEWRGEGMEKKKKEKREEKESVQSVEKTIFFRLARKVFYALFIVYRGQVTVQSFVRCVRFTWSHIHCGERVSPQSMHHSNSWR